MKRTYLVTAFAAVVCLLICGPDAVAQSYGPSGGVEVEGVVGGTPTPVAHAGLDSLTNAAGTSGGANPTKVLSVAGTDGTLLHGLRTDSSGNVFVLGAGTLTVQGASGSPVPLQVAFAAPTRHDFSTTLSATATLLASGSGVLLGATASTAAVLGGILCFYDGDPAASGRLISGFNITTGALGALTGVPLQGLPYTNGLYVRPGTSIVTCASLGTSLALGFGSAVTSP